MVQFAKKDTEPRMNASFTVLAAVYLQFLVRAVLCIPGPSDVAFNSTAMVSTIQAYLLVKQILQMPNSLADIYRHWWIGSVICNSPDVGPAKTMPIHAFTTDSPIGRTDPQLVSNTLDTFCTA